MIDSTPVYEFFSQGRTDWWCVLTFFTSSQTGSIQKRFSEHRFDLLVLRRCAVGAQLRRIVNDFVGVLGNRQSCAGIQTTPDTWHNSLAVELDAVFEFKSCMNQ